MQVQVVVYSAESYYTESFSSWQESLASPLRERLRLRDPFSFARNKAQADAFKHDIDAERFWDKVYRDTLGAPQTVAVTPTTRVDQLVAELTAPYRAQGNEGEQNLLSFFRLALARAHLLQFPSGHMLQPDATLQQEGVEDGDVLGLMLVYPPSGNYYQMIPVPDSAQLFAVIRSSDANPPSYIDPFGPSIVQAGDADRSVPHPHPPRIWGALLYTDEDAELAIYIRKHFPSLHQLSGELFHIFVIETPPDDWRPAAGYWKASLQDTLDLFYTWLTMGWLSSKPYDKSQAYELARKLGVYPDQIPCLVLFDTVKRPNKLVFPIADVSPTFFRCLFSLLERSISPHITSPDAYVQIQQQYEAILRTVTASKTRLTEDNRQSYTCDGITMVINTVDQRDQLDDRSQRGVAMEQQWSGIKNLPEDQIEPLYEALLGTFRSGELQRIVRFSLGKNLEAIVGGDTYADVVLNLVIWANDNGKIGALIHEAQKEAPGSPKLNDFLRQLKVEVKPGDADHSEPSRKLSDQLRNDLVRALLNVPDIFDPATRTALLTWLPSNIGAALPRAFSNPSNDLAGIVGYLEQLGRLAGEEMPLLRLIDAALPRVAGIDAGEKLRQVRQQLVEFYKQREG